MNVRKTFGTTAKILVFLVAFAVVIMFNLYIKPEFMGNLRFFFRIGDWFSVLFILVETFIMGKIFEILLVWTFKMEFERR